MIPASLMAGMDAQPQTGQIDPKLEGKTANHLETVRYLSHLKTGTGIYLILDLFSTYMVKVNGNSQKS